MDVALSQVGFHGGHDLVLAGVDPGREKFGWVLSKEDGTLLLGGIAPISALPVFLDALRTRRWESLEPWHTEGCAENVPNEAVRVLFLGNGTGSEKMEKLLSEGAFSLRVVEERYSTLDARRLYWELHPPRGMRRLLPLSLQVPPRPLDDLAAWSTLLAALGPEKIKKPSWISGEGRVE